ncbi:MAG TPA: c-type cytochrome [Candidatus Angelobacter sp.]|jgi:cytochrome c|nr:c-type cytochrome [Candidatus Angelobacter sp.]
MRNQEFSQPKIENLFSPRNPAQRLVHVLMVLSLAVIGPLAWLSSTEVSGGQNSNDSGDPNRGKEVFGKRCAGCHALDREKQGPRLRGVFGRKSGSIASFKYSEALKSANVIWDSSSLDQWLTDPDKFIPDTDMDFHLSDSGERNDVIAYLKQLSKP